MRFSKLVTDVKSSSWAGRIVRTTISQRLALDIIQVSFWESIFLNYIYIFSSSYVHRCGKNVYVSYSMFLRIIAKEF